ncbi:MAG: ComEC/Rec2 family competence protein [Candidatus Paceibacterota bacterium]
MKRNSLLPSQIFRKSGVSFLLGFFFSLFFKNYFSLDFPFYFLFFLFTVFIFLFYFSKKYSFLYLCFFVLGFLRPFWNFSLGVPFYSFLSDFSLRIKKFIENQFSLFFTPSQKEILLSLFFGAKDNLSYSLKQKFQKVGLSHIVAVSGFHLSFLNKGLFFVLEDLLFLRKYLVFIFIFIFDLFFALMANFSPSVIRSLVMAFLAILASLNYRFYYPTNVLLFSLILMIFLNPSIFFDIGFQLSFLATFGILYLYPFFEKLFLKENEENFSMNFLKEYLGRVKISLLKIFFLNLSALTFTFPLIIYYFSNFSLISFLVNLLVLPVIPIVMAGAILVFAFSLFSFYLGLFFSVFEKIFLNYIFLIINFFFKYPFNVSFAPKLKILFLIFYTFLGTLVFIALNSKKLNLKK